MGVTGLWTVVAPTARPTKVETLNRKRLAIDASIWIYQFLKAVRDKEGNALRNSHVVGFFRRICKLLYFGIKPVFVFDGGAPILKRETVRKRAARREGRRDDAARTAGKLLAVQVARAAEEEAARQKDARARPDEEEIPEDQELVYVDEIGMNQQQRQTGRGFKKQDQYHLPELNMSIEEMGAPNDPRVMSQAELETYAKQFHDGEDINLYDFSKIDFDSSFFQSLPAGDKYNILNAARLRSRMRMGYSKEQLDVMFPDRAAFSRFQIERVKERNELTQRLMHVSGMAEGEWDMGSRIAGERGKEYVLVPHDGVEGGWALGVVSNRKGSKKDTAIDLDAPDEADEAGSEDEDFEDVAIEGINRIPQSWKRKRQQVKEVDYDISYEEAAERIAKKRKAVYEGRKKAVAQPSTTPSKVVPTKPTMPKQQSTSGADDDALFVEQGNVSAEDEDDVFEDVTMTVPLDDDQDDLQRAIAMSLEKPDDEGGFIATNDDKAILSDNDDNDFDLQAALAESRSSKYQSKTIVRASPPHRPKKAPFAGPLPFESLNLGQSLLGKKKAKKTEEKLAGGFDRELGDDAFKKPKKAQPEPHWFSNSAESRPLWAQAMDETAEGQGSNGVEDVDDTEVQQQKKPMREVIDLEADNMNDQPEPEIVEVLEASRDDWNALEDEEHLRQQEEADKKALEAEEVAEARRKALQEEREKRYELARQIAAENEDPKMDEVADLTRADPPPPSGKPTNIPTVNIVTTNGDNSEDEEVEWSESDHEQPENPSEAILPQSEEPAGGRMPDQQAAVESDDEDDTFEDVEKAPSPPPFARRPTPPSIQKQPSVIDQSMFVDDDEAQAADQAFNNNEAAPETSEPQQDFFEDDSDEELMRQLANEAEEHFRFSNELNNTRPKSPTQAMRDYENELKQLRNQQKKDRRDADEVTQTMIQECQALLRLFGLPYITAPMEAEAQCAELVHLGLVDGIVTDDSDIFLFGGTRIYKNMFNAQKFVECYLSGDLEKEYALDRRKLIRFAHLLGSDYTEGIPGIGPVTALEIISDFPDLVDFKEWTLKVQLGLQTPSVMEGLLTTAFRRKFKRTVQRKLFLPTNFPDLRVDQAYLDPEVDANPEEFQWGVPDLDKLRNFLMATIGWSQDRTDEILVPVIRDMNKRDVEGVQSNITRFFAGGVGAGTVVGRGINGSTGTGTGTGGASVEGTAPRNRTGKESGRMKNAYTRLRSEAEKKKRGALLDELPDDGVDGDNEGDVDFKVQNHDDHDEEEGESSSPAATGKKQKSKHRAAAAKSKKPGRQTAKTRKTRSKT
ncbi:DNA repair protein rad2 [Lithohypha guttulata]|nr:DNA repair protein rad2 [Lithohypha guttulata]